MFRRLSVLVIFAFWASVATANPRCVFHINDGTTFAAPRIDLADSVFDLMEDSRLQPQNTQDLEDRGLIVPHGGLCVSTCVTNIVKVLLYAEGWRDYATEKFLPSLLNWLHDTGRNLDPRKGASFHQFRGFFEELGEDFSRDFEWNSFHYDKHAAIPESLLMPRKNHLVMAGIQIAPIGHAVLVVDVDSDRKVLRISDPRNPNEVHAYDYSNVRQNGRKTILVHDFYGQEGVVSEVLVVTSEAKI